MSTLTHPKRRPGPPRALVCHRGHPMSGPNLIVCGRLHQCRACKNERRRRTERVHRVPGFRASRPGVVLARGPLDYDVPVTRRCDLCGNVWTETLGDCGPCPHCARFARGAA